MENHTDRDNGPVRIKAWIQMGTERRETVIEIPREEFEGGVRHVEKEPYKCLEGGLEAYVLDWVNAQYGWGWSGCGIENDFGFMEGCDPGSLAVTSDSSVPNTVLRRVRPRPERQSASED